MNVYRTAQVARLIGIHPNTVRLYEELQLIPKPERGSNGYRIFTDYHIEQLKLARTAFQVEVLQNGLRKKAVAIIKTSAKGEFDQAIALTDSYLQQLYSERDNAEEAVAIATQLLSGETPETGRLLLTRKEAADYLEITMDTLRNWERNGLLTVTRRQNGYRVYTDEDIKRLKIIRSLRCANYSLSAILRMLSAHSLDPGADVRRVIDTPRADEDILSVCDKLITSLTNAIEHALRMRQQLGAMKVRFGTPPP